MLCLIVKPGPELELVDCQLLLSSCADPLDLKYPECLLQYLLAFTWFSVYEGPFAFSVLH
jgi:hypothetical protein